MSQRPGRDAAHYLGWPLQRQGHPKIVSNRFAETIFGTRPLSAGDLCQPSGPDGEGQAEGQARNSRGGPPRGFSTARKVALDLGRVLVA